MQLERILQSQGFGTRRECRALVRLERVTVRGEMVDDPFVDVDTADLDYTVDGEAWRYHEPSYVMLHKPAGYECSQKPKHHPSVLNLTVRIKQLGAGYAHLRTQGMVEQLVQPSLADNCCVIIQQHQIFATCFAGRHIVDGRVVKRVWVTQYPHFLLTHLLHTGKPGTRFSCFAGIIDNQQLVIFVSGFLQQALDATLQDWQLILGRHDDRNQRLLAMTVADAITPRKTRQ